MSPRIVQIADLNDLLRTTFLTGKVVFTQGIAALSEDKLTRSGAFLMGFCLYQFSHDIVRLSAPAGFLWRFDSRWNATRKRHLRD